jgi:hypothetical protein
VNLMTSSLFITSDPCVHAQIWVQMKMLFQRSVLGAVLGGTRPPAPLGQSERKLSVPHGLGWGPLPQFPASICQLVIDRDAPDRVLAELFI